MNIAAEPLLQGFCHQHRLAKEFEHTALTWFIPCAELLYHHQLGENKPFFVGINGCQGSGKSTLSEFMRHYLSAKYQIKVAVLSLDDFYYDQNQRQRLSQQIHPLLQTRGVPGTHDTKLMAQVLKQLQQGLSTALPKFNKATDNPEAQQQWQTSEAELDLVIIEGWCWGTPAQQKTELEQAVNALEANQDQQATWRTFVNEQLTQEYIKLYEYCDFWLMLKAPNFACVSQWRKEQEHKLIEKLGNKPHEGLMSDSQIDHFIQHYQRLTQHTLTALPDDCDLVFELNSKREISQAFGPASQQLQTLQQQGK